MRPNVQTTRDPINLDAMPPMDGMELDYRTGLAPERAEFAQVIYHLVCYAVLGLAIVFGLRITGLVHFLSTPLVFAIVVLIGGLAGLWKYLSQEPLRVWLTWLLAGPLLWGLLVVTKGRGQVLLCLPVFLLATYLAHRMVVHHARWMHANPNLDRETRLDWLRIWFTPVTEPRAKNTRSQISPVVEYAEQTRYRYGFAAVAVAYLLGAIIYDPAQPFSGQLAVFVFLAVLLLFGLYNCVAYRRGRIPFQVFVSAMSRSFGSWFTYNAHDTQAPGVFQSPDGSADTRRRFARTALLAISLAVLPLASYFPIAVVVSSQRPWLEAASTPWTWPWDDQNTKPSIRLPDPPSHDEVLATLTPFQKTYLTQLPSEAHRGVFLDQLATTQHRIAVAKALEPVQAALTGTPESWLLVALRGAFTGRTLFIWSVIFSGLFCILIPPLLFYAICFALGGRVLVHFHLTLEADGAEYHRPEELCETACYQQRLHESRYATTDQAQRQIREKDHLFVGVSTQNDYPVLLHRDILTEHAHFTGDSGSGKTSLGIASIVDQLIGRSSSSIVILDLKGDEALFTGTRIAAERAGIPFQWLTNRPDSATYAFNPFRQAHMENLPKPQLAQILLKSLGLEYGEGYGPAFFSSINRNVLTETLDEYPEIDSFKRLRHFLTTAGDFSNRVPRDQRERAAHLTSVVNSLATFDALNVTPSDGLPSAVMEQRIDMSKAIAAPHVIYFFLHSALQESTVREVAKLALHSLLAAAILNKHRDNQVYLFVDEFQQIVSEDLKIVLRMARDSRIATVLANQTISDLVTDAADLRPIVQANTRYKQVFSSTDLNQQDDLIKASGDAMYETLSWNEDYEDGTIDSRIGHREMIGPRFMRNDLIEMSDMENASIVHVSRGRGYTQYAGYLFSMYSQFHITHEEYVRRATRPWPSEEENTGTFTPPLEQHDNDSAPTSKVPAKSKPKPRPKRTGPRLPAATGTDIGSLLDDL